MHARGVHNCDVLHWRADATLLKQHDNFGLCPGVGHLHLSVEQVAERCGYYYLHHFCCALCEYLCHDPVVGSSFVLLPRRLRLARSRRCRPPRGALYRVCPGAIRISKVATTGYSGGGKPEQHKIDIIMLGVPAYPPSSWGLATVAQAEPEQFLWSVTVISHTYASGFTHLATNTTRRTISTAPKRSPSTIFSVQRKPWRRLLP